MKLTAPLAIVNIYGDWLSKTVNSTIQTTTIAINNSACLGCYLAYS